MKALPHRLRDGRCRDCGHHDSYSAPDTCARCALDRMRERGYGVVLDPVLRFDRGGELWRQTAMGIRNGGIRSGRFYVMVGHNDGGSLGLPMGDLSPAEWEAVTAQGAHRTARGLTQRYPQVWVVTTVGCWNAVPHTTQEER